MTHRRSPTLRIELPANRDYTGIVKLVDEAGRAIAGPFAVCGRSSDQLAEEHGNPSRATTLPYGDTPLGSYRIDSFVATGGGTKYRADLFGAHGAFILRAISGDAALAEANGRFEILIHGGPLSPDGRLRATTGAMRMADDDLLAIANHIDQQRGLICECVQTAILPASVKVEGGFTFEEPRRRSSKAAWITPRARRALTPELIAHGEYAPEDEPTSQGAPLPELIPPAGNADPVSLEHPGSTAFDQDIDPFSGETSSSSLNADPFSGRQPVDPFTGSQSVNPFTCSSSSDPYSSVDAGTTPSQAQSSGIQSIAAHGDWASSAPLADQSISSDEKLWSSVSEKESPPNSSQMSQVPPEKSDSDSADPDAVATQPEKSVYSSPTGPVQALPPPGAGGTDVFVFGGFERFAPDVLVKPGGELLGLAGYSSNQGFYVGGIRAGGIELGTEATHVGGLTGTEYTYSFEEGYQQTGINILYGQAGPEVPLVGGFGVGYGTYQTRTGEEGSFVFGEVRVFGVAVEVGIGLSGGLFESAAY